MSRETIRSGKSGRVGEVLGLGAVAIDEVLTVAFYPAADGKARVLCRDQRVGGLAGTAMMAASRLGARCRYAGVIGTGEPGEIALVALRGAGVDPGLARRRAGAGPIRSTIVVGRDDASRTIFSDRAGFVGPDPDWPEAGVIRSAGAVLVDHIGTTSMSRAARIAREAGVPVVGDFERDEEPGFPALLALTDHLILGRSFAARLSGTDDPAEAALRLWRADRAVVVVTCGASGCWAVDARDPTTPRHVPSLPVVAVDTTGCGDVFHGAYAASLAEGRPLADRLRFASAAAGIAAARPVARRELPGRAEVEESRRSLEV